MSFNTTRLQDDRVIVAGTDVNGIEGTAVIDGTQWFELNGHNQTAEAQAEFDRAMKEFYAPVNEAVDKLNAAKAGKVDPLNFIVVQEAVAGQAAQDETIVQLTHDSKIMRLIDESEVAPRLVWVTAGDKVSLEILAEAKITAPPASSEEELQDALKSIGLNSSN